MFRVLKVQKFLVIKFSKFREFRVSRFHCSSNEISRLHDF
jgi:hypothetical protein